MNQNNNAKWICYNASSGPLFPHAAKPPVQQGNLNKMDSDNLPFYLKKIGQVIDKKFSDAVTGGDKTEVAKKETPMPPMRNENMDYMEPDWDELDKKADLIVARYSVVSAAMNILPLPFDVMGVTGTFSKMATELAGIYQVIVSNKRARQMGWAIARHHGLGAGPCVCRFQIGEIHPRRLLDSYGGAGSAGWCDFVGGGRRAQKLFQAVPSRKRAVYRVVVG